MNAQPSPNNASDGVTIYCNRLPLQHLTAINKLREQLDSTGHVITHQDLSLMNDGKTPERITLFAHHGSDQRSELIGFISLVRNQFLTVQFLTLGDFIVNESDRCKGTGQALLAAALVEARKTDAAYIVMTSNANRKKAHHIYKKFGFVQIASSGNGTTLFYLDLKSTSLQ